MKPFGDRQAAAPFGPDTPFGRPAF